MSKVCTGPPQRAISESRCFICCTFSVAKHYGAEVKD